MYKKVSSAFRARNYVHGQEKITISFVIPSVDGLHKTTLTTIFDETCMPERLSLAESCVMSVDACTIVYLQVWHSMMLCAIHLL